MDKTLTKDAKGFVAGVVSYLRNEGSSKTVVPKVQALLQKVTNQARKEKVAHVQTSVALTSDEKLTLSRLLMEYIGHTVELDVHVDPELLGGFRIQVGDWIVDTSLKSHLADMADQLTG